METYKDKEKDFHMMFIDLEKNLWQTSKNLMDDFRGVQITNIQVIEDIYYQTKMYGMTCNGDHKIFFNHNWILSRVHIISYLFTHDG